MSNTANSIQHTMGGRFKGGTSRSALVRLCVAVGAALLVACLPLGLDATVQRVLSITTGMILLFMLEPIPIAISGLLGCTMYVIAAGLPFGTAFHGFSEQTPWYVFGAALIGVMVTKSGLAKRMALLILLKAGTSFPRILLGVLIMDFMLAFVMPTGIARVVLLGSVCVGLVQAMGLGKGSNIGKSLLIAVSISAALFDKGILAGSTALLGRAFIAQYTGYEILYSEWMIFFIPFDILTLFAMQFLLLKMFPPEDVSAHLGKEYAERHLAELGPLTGDERKVIVLTLCTTLLWMTDFLHGLKPAWIGILAGIATTMPYIGILKEEDVRKSNFLMVIFVGAALSLGTVIIETGTSRALSSIMFTWLKPFMGQEAPLTYLVIYVYNFLLHIMLGDELALIVSTMPPVMQFAIDQGFNPTIMGLMWTYATGAKIFIYQCGPLVAGYAFGFFSTRDFLKLASAVCVFMAAVAAFLPYWWRLFL